MSQTTATRAAAILAQQFRTVPDIQTAALALAAAMAITYPEAAAIAAALIGA